MRWSLTPVLSGSPKLRWMFLPPLPSASMPDLEGEKGKEMGGTFASSSFTSQNWKGIPSPACRGPPSLRGVLILPTLCLFHGQPSKLRFLFYKSPTLGILRKAFAFPC